MLIASTRLGPYEIVAALPQGSQVVVFLELFDLLGILEVAGGLGPASSRGG